MMNFIKAFDMQRYDFLKADENCGEGGGRGWDFRKLLAWCLLLLSYSFSAFLIAVDDTFVVILRKNSVLPSFRLV